GAPGITVHPRADERHITTKDVHDVAAFLRGSPSVEYNIEGDPRPGFIDLVLTVKPTQCTLVPVMPGEITSQAGWRPATSRTDVGSALDAMRVAGVRISLFVDPEDAPIRWAADPGGARIELYTEPYARAFERGAGEASFDTYAKAATLAHS